MILPVYVAPNPVLTTPTAPVSEVTDEIRQLAADMRETMHNAQGVGLAAPQVGKSLALLVVENDQEDSDHTFPYTVFINPRITWSSTRQVKDEEGCLSLPGIWGDVKRPVRVRVKAQDLTGALITYELDGLLARVVQHEMDHLKGILFTTLVPKTKLRFREAPDYPRI